MLTPQSMRWMPSLCWLMAICLCTTQAASMPPAQGSQPIVGSPPLLIYNRMPKTGSSTMQAALAILSKRLGYRCMQHTILNPLIHEMMPFYQHYVRGTPAFFGLANHDLDRADMRKMVWKLSVLPAQHASPLVLVYHFPFIDFTAFGLPQPLYVNTLRDPSDRLVSDYYYMRHGPRNISLKRLWIAAFGDLRIEECAALYERCGCTGDCSRPPQAAACTRGQCGDLFMQFNSQIMYFCDWGADECRVPGPAALARAKRNLVAHYTSFGLLERRNESLALLEAALPRFFTGLAHLPEAHDVRKANKNRELVPEAAMAFLRRANALDYDFYAFANELMDERLRRMNLTAAGGSSRAARR